MLVMTPLAKLTRWNDLNLALLISRCCPMACSSCRVKRYVQVGSTYCTGSVDIQRSAWLSQEAQTAVK